MFRKLYKHVLAEVCCLCDSPGLPGIDLCHECHKNLPHNHFCCNKCAAPLQPSSSVEPNKTTCGKCLSEAAGVDNAIIPYLYRPPVDFMVKRLKFSEENKYSRILGELLSDAIEKHYNDRSGHQFPDVILPVPVHHQRRVERGFNQAEQIARTVAHRVNRPLDTESVTRSLSPTQTRLSAAQRAANIRQAFEVQQPQKIKGLHVAVVDDVYTTGATAKAISQRLQAAGAAKVSIWAAARTP